MSQAHDDPACETQMPALLKRHNAAIRRLKAQVASLGNKL